MQTFRKIKRVQPLIKVKQQRVDGEQVALDAIRAEKHRVVQEMKERQRRYMSGVEQLNQVRQSPARVNLETLETGLDFVKSQWYQLYKSIQDLEGKEKAQISRVLTAERELKSIEKLRERYETDLKAEAGKEERRLMDELALQKFAGRPQTPRT